MACTTCGAIRAELVRAVRAVEPQAAAKAAKQGVRTLAAKAAQSILHRKPAVTKRGR